MTLYGRSDKLCRLESTLDVVILVHWLFRGHIFAFSFWFSAVSCFLYISLSAQFLPKRRLKGERTIKERTGRSTRKNTSTDTIFIEGISVLNRKWRVNDHLTFFLPIDKIKRQLFWTACLYRYKIKANLKLWRLKICR